MTHTPSYTLHNAAILVALFLFPILPATAQPNKNLSAGDVLVNEILFNPLPDGSDYVELYNNSDDTIPLSSLRMAKMNGDTIAKLYNISATGHINPHDFIVVTTDASYVCNNYTVRFPQKIIEVSSLPSYANAAGTVAVATVDSTLLDRFDYTEKMHSRLLRDKEGVALERRSYDTPTQQPGNWYSAASTAGFGTPAERNSQSREFLFVDNDFSIEPTLFSPDGDGYNDVADITYRLQECGLSCNIDIYDARGRLVRHLVRGALLGCEGVLTWDGSDEQGHLCRRGNYVLVGEAYNSDGARQSWRRRVSLVVE